MDKKPITQINIDLNSFVQEIRQKETVIVSGTNNCGKSYLLRRVNEILGHKAYYLACQRFFNIHQINSRVKQENEERENFRNFLNQFNQTSNFDESTTNLMTSLTGLKQDQLDTVLDLCSELIGDKFENRRVMEGYPYTNHYIAVNDYNISWSSTGSRLLLTILAIMVNTAYETVLLDEPELGLTPSLQTKLASIF